MLEGWGVEDVGGNEGGETVIRIYLMKKYFQLEHKKRNRNLENSWPAVLFSLCYTKLCGMKGNDMS